MQVTRLEFCKMDIERILISLGMTFMEGVGLLMLICGILGIKIF